MTKKTLALVVLPLITVKMLIHSGIIALDYSPATDVLVASIPYIQEFSSSEVGFCLDLIAENARGYHVRNLLLDSSKSVVDVEDKAYKAITTKFAVDLTGTRLKKLARVVTGDAAREERSARVFEELRQEVNLPVEFRNFKTKEEAMDWLLSK